MFKFSTKATIFALFAVVHLTPSVRADDRPLLSGLNVDIRDLAVYTNHPYVTLSKILLKDLVERTKKISREPNEPNYFLYAVSFDLKGPQGDSFEKIPLSPEAKLKLPPELRSEAALTNELYNLPDEVPSEYARDLISIGKPENPEKPRTAYVRTYLSGARGSKVFSAQIEAEPMIDDEDENLLHVPLLTYVNLKSDFSDSFFQRFDVTVDTQKKRVVQITEKGPEINIKKTSFNFVVDLFGRKLIAQDAKNDITIVYPLGVGGLDDGVTTSDRSRRLMTPTINNGYLIKSSAKVMLEHCFPDYFNCRPFLPIFDSPTPTDGWTKLGLHGPITAKLLRGFVSHGCMRMREKDLYEVTSILLGSSQAKLPITIMLDSESSEFDHPMPLYNERYFSVYNAGTVAVPKVRLDEEGLALTQPIKGPLNLEGISEWNRRNPGPLSPILRKKPHHH
jgi:hypothetical protein